MRTVTPASECIVSLRERLKVLTSVVYRCLKLSEYETVFRKEELSDLPELTCNNDNKDLPSRMERLEKETKTNLKQMYIFGVMDLANDFKIHGYSVDLEKIREMAGKRFDRDFVKSINERGEKHENNIKD